MFYIVLVRLYTFKNLFYVQNSVLQLQVKTRYYDSILMGHATAKIILEKFLELDIDLRKVLQLSMDGPAVNFKVHSLLSKQINVSMF